MNAHKQKLIWDSRYHAEGKIWGADPSHAAKLAVLEGYIQGGKKIAELGGGYGRNSAFFKEIGANPTLFDISDIALENARKSYGLENTAKVDLTKSLPAEYLGGYDVVFCNFVLHLLDSKERSNIIENSNLLLKDNGISIWTFLSTQDNEYRKGECVGENDYKMPRTSSIFHFFSMEEIRRLFFKWNLKLVQACNEIEMIIRSVKKTDFWFVVAQKVGK
ncbi:MAG: class I SAM-dependent methyltransferase [Candidatus Micrarchaeia archaeon]